MLSTGATISISNQTKFKLLNSIEATLHGLRIDQCMHLLFILVKLPKGVFLDVPRRRDVNMYHDTMNCNFSARTPFLNWFYKMHAFYLFQLTSVCEPTNLFDKIDISSSYPSILKQTDSFLVVSLLAYSVGRWIHSNRCTFHGPPSVQFWTRLYILF